MKRIAIFSDIHGNLQALNSIIDDINNTDFDEVICLGDVIGLGPNSKQCLDIIMDSKIKMVKGNHEIYQINEELYQNHLADNEKKHRDWIKKTLSDEEINYIANLPMSYEELIEGNLYTFSHFILDSSKEYFESLEVLGDNKIFELAKKQETDYMFIGHNHTAFQISSTNLLTCAGSCGCRKDETTFYTILEINGKDVKFSKKEISYNRKEFEKTFKENNYPDRERVGEIFFGINLKN